MNIEDLPKISICMPIWNRPEFIPLIVYNVFNLQYPKDKLELVIDDDSDSDKKLFSDKNVLNNFKKVINPIKVKYLYSTNKRSIGAKRNNLVKNSTYNIIACMDSDDIYLPSYLLHSIDIMKKNNATCVGSNQMMFLYPFDNWLMTGIRCQAKRQIHEATAVFTKKHFRSMGGFIKSSQGEGSKLVDFNDKNVALTQIKYCMVCIAHKNNTINKDMFKDGQDVQGQLDSVLLNIISSIFNIPVPQKAPEPPPLPEVKADDACPT